MSVIVSTRVRFTVKGVDDFFVALLEIVCPEFLGGCRRLSVLDCELPSYQLDVLHTIKSLQHIGLHGVRTGRSRRERHCRAVAVQLCGHWGGWSLNAPNGIPEADMRFVAIALLADLMHCDRAVYV